MWVSSSRGGALVLDGSVKLRFRTHYPQIETKLTVRGADMDEIQQKLAPVEAEVRQRLGNFILGEDTRHSKASCSPHLPSETDHWRWSRPFPPARSPHASPICRALKG